MDTQAKIGRRSFLSMTAMAVALAEFGGLSFAKAESKTESASTVDIPKPLSAGFNQIKQIKAGDLNIGYAELGPAQGRPVILLHGWPYDIHSYVEVAGILAAKGFRVIVPHLRGHGTTNFLSADAVRNGQQSALAVDVIALIDALKIKKAIIGGFDWGARTANIVAALYSERCDALVSVSGYLIGSQKANSAPLSPKSELAWWYQFYFATERGRLGYQANTKDFAKLIWQQASPTWKFTAAEFERSMASLNNPDHVDIVIHNYRWRLGLAEGEERYDALEGKLAARPFITIPAITLEGSTNGAPHPEPSAYADKFKGRYEHRNVDNIGHNFPQEAPEEFAKAIVDVAGWG